MAEAMEWEMQDGDDVDDYMLGLAIEASIKEYENSQRVRAPNNNDDDGALAGPSGYRPNVVTDDDKSLDGFDQEAGRTWVYPVNYTQRDYQFNIVKKGLFHNTLVCLPTGLGKTFIAAVVMYNFYRWYPQSKIVFMAPTKPLVAQQIQACFQVMGIPQHDMIEMTGSMNPTDRKLAWKTNRVFFLTPQVMSNDLSRGICEADKVRCLVVDEAHRALGNHAYVVVVRELSNYTKDFRVLALSATPGSDGKAVQQVITNLLISAVEIRTDESIDIRPYVHDRVVEKIVIPLSDEIVAVKANFMEVVNMNVKRLSERGVLWNRNAESLSQFALLKERDKFRQNPPERLPRSDFSYVESQFALCASLYHCLELLQMHGLRSFYNFVQGIMDGQKSQPFTRRELSKNSKFMAMFNQVKSKFDPVLAEPNTFVIGHPKMEKLLQIVLEHFNRFKNAVMEDGEVSTRVMIFAQYRDTVTEITNTLEQHQPLIKAMSFVGRATSGPVNKGLSHKLQQQIVARFRNGHYNTLVSTCVGEEGLDIGDVDLIICYDAHKSPVRLVQRMGRTGRKRDGRIVMLVTQGKEESIYNQGQLNKRSINRAIAMSDRLYNMFPNSPRMIPQGLEPTCHKMLLHAGDFQVKVGKRAAKTETSGNNKFIKRLKKSDSGFLTEVELSEWNRRYKVDPKEIYRLESVTEMLSLANNDDADQKMMNSLRFNGDSKVLTLDSRLPWQTTLQSSHLVSHTATTKLFVRTMRALEMRPQKGDINESKGGNKSLVKSPPKKLISDFFQMLPKSPNKIQPSKKKVVPVHTISLEDEISIAAVNYEPVKRITDFFRYPKSVTEPQRRPVGDPRLTAEQVAALRRWMDSLNICRSPSAMEFDDGCSDDELFLLCDMPSMALPSTPAAVSHCNPTETMCGMTQMLELMEETPSRTLTAVKPSLKIATDEVVNKETHNFHLYLEESDDEDVISASINVKPTQNVLETSKKNEIQSISPIRKPAFLTVESPLSIAGPSHSTPKVSSMKKPDSLSKVEIPRVKNNKLGIGRRFIQSQAEVDGEENSLEEDDDDRCPNQYVNDSFVDDETDMSLDETQIGAYLRSVKDTERPGKAFSTKAGNRCQDVFSQETNSDDSSYLEDSFCVGNDDLEFEEKTSKRNEGHRKWKRIVSARKNDSATSDEAEVSAIEAATPAVKSEGASKTACGISVAGPSRTEADAVVKKTSSNESVNIFVSSREVASASGIISNLRNKHKVMVHVRPLTNCDYILSNRVAVERKTVSEVANIQSHKKLLISMKEMSSVYEKPYLLIEDDRVKVNEHARPMLHTVYYDSVLVQIAQSPVRTLFSHSQDETAELLVSVSESEARKGYRFESPCEPAEGKESAFRVYCTLPDLSLCEALNFCHRFKNLKEFINSSSEEKVLKGRITRNKADIIQKYLHHRVSK